MKTSTKGKGVLLLAVGLLLLLMGYTGTGKWGGSAIEQGDVKRDRYAGPQRTLDDRQEHTIKLFVSYKPARQLSITWGIGHEGDYERRQPGDRPEWEITRYKVKPGTAVALAVDNFDRGGYLNCQIIQDEVTVRHLNETTTERDSCDFTFIVGSRPE